MDIDSFIVHVKTDDICIDIPEDVETRFDTNYEIDRLLSMGLSSDWINERWIRWTNHEKKFVRLRAKTCTYLKDNDAEYKKAKGTKTWVVKGVFKFRDYKNF